MAEVLAARPATDIVYSDEDKLDPGGRRFDPYFKPDFSPDLLLSQNLISHLGVYRAERVRAVGGFREGFEGSQDHDLALRVLERSSPERVDHVPRVLYHWRQTPVSTARRLSRKDYAHEAGRRAIAEHLARTGRRATVERSLESFYRVRYALPDPLPSVSVVALEPLVGALEASPASGAFPLESCDVPGDARETRAERLDAAIRAAAGAVVVLLGPGCEPSSGWLDELVTQAVRPGGGGRRGACSLAVRARAPRWLPSLARRRPAGGLRSRGPAVHGARPLWPRASGSEPQRGGR